MIKEKFMSVKKTAKQFIEESKLIHGSKYDYSNVEYIDSKTKVCIICPEHGEFWQSPLCHANKHYGCPICDESHLESEIRQFLLENKINFIQEYKCDWLGKQFLDFYLPEYNAAIECQGEGHFKPVRFNGIGWDKAKDNFNKCVKLDKEKKEKCDKNNVTLIYYSNLQIKYPYNVLTEKNKILNILKNE